MDVTDMTCTSSTGVTTAHTFVSSLTNNSLYSFMTSDIGGSDDPFLRSEFVIVSRPLETPVPGCESAQFLTPD